jgi:subtilisin family serine protease
MDFDPRAELVGDNVNDINDTPYGNPDVKGPRADHGTMVAGLVAATRSNGLGIDGIANSVEIMVLRVVPDGDEYDKDVALAIRYAADNGAQIMNMSFGKAFSPNQKMVWDALRYAASKNILMVKASGNETIDIDSDVHYPTAFTPEGKIDNIITVGANDMKKGKKMSAVFSNYGATGVDIFAPGVDIVSPSPDQNYGKASGTSFASPVVTGVAALIWSYFPELTASELRTILLESGTYYGKQKVVLFNRDTEVKTKTTFGKLSVTGRIINAYNAFLMAEAKTKKQ